MSLLSLQVDSVASGYSNRDTYVVAKVTFVMCHRSVVYLLLKLEVSKCFMLWSLIVWWMW